MSKPAEAWRLFVAVELPQTVRAKIGQHIARLRRELPDARASWIREQNLHLTLKFFGDIPVGKVEAVSGALRAAANDVPAFEIELGGCGAFPSRGKPNVLWIGIKDPSGDLHRLFEALEKECAQARFDRERRPFHPHLTIARLRDPRDAKLLAESHQTTGFETVSFKAADVCLIRSELSSQGSRYTVLARHDLIAH